MQAYRPAASGMVLRGFVVSGRREAAGFVSVQSVRQQLQQLLGDAPYPGTLNVQLRDPQSLAAWHGRAASGTGLVLPAGEPGFCASTYFSVVLKGTTRCGTVPPHVRGIPPTSSRSSQRTTSANGSGSATATR